MKLPRYLQVALALTAGITLWSQFSGDDFTPDSATLTTSVTRAQTSQAARAITPAVTARHNLFPLPESVTAAQQAREKAPPPPPKAPPLPLEVMGAWWQQQQRIVILTNGKDSWPVCEKCQAEDKVWLGSSPVRGWTLVEVANDHLEFEWQATHLRQRLSLEEFALEKQ